YSRGIPRLVNLLCEHSMISAYVDHLRPVPPRLVEEVAREFELDECECTSPSRFASEAERIANTQALVQNLDQLLGRLRQADVAATPVPMKGSHESHPGSSEESRTRTRFCSGNRAGRVAGRSGTPLTASRERGKRS